MLAWCLQNAPIAPRLASADHTWAAPALQCTHTPPVPRSITSVASLCTRSAPHPAACPLPCQVRTHRRSYRDRRAAAPIPVVALVGYTNAGACQPIARRVFSLQGSTMMATGMRCLALLAAGAIQPYTLVVLRLQARPPPGSAHVVCKTRCLTLFSPSPSLLPLARAGKSTLLNTLTNAGVLAEDKLFATLDPTTR